MPLNNPGDEFSIDISSACRSRQGGDEIAPSGDAITMESGDTITMESADTITTE